MGWNQGKKIGSGKLVWRLEEEVLNLGLAGLINEGSNPTTVTN